MKTPAAAFALACLVLTATAPRKGRAETAPWPVDWAFPCTIADAKDVADADSFTCRETWPGDQDRRIEVRLRGVNGVEVGEPGYQEAKRFARLLYVGETFSCRVAQTNLTRGRIGAFCTAELDLGKVLVLSGHAGDCPAYSGGAYAEFEPRPFPVAAICQAKTRSEQAP